MLLLSKFMFPSVAPPPPKTISKEWEEASNERALEQKMNPISGSSSPQHLFLVRSHSSHIGIASEGYSGKGFVTHK